MTEDIDLIDAFVRTRELLLLAADEVPEELRATPFVGDWNLMDLLAHLVGWDYTNLQAIEELRRGVAPAFYQHYDPGWNSYNQQLVERYGTGDWGAMREALGRSQAAIEDVLRGLSAEELSRQRVVAGRTRPVTIAGILRAAVRDEEEHLDQIRAFVADVAASGR